MSTNEYQEPSNPTEPVVFAHRGLRRWAPENTLPAFAAAIEVGLSLELDVYQTSDEGLVVIHDETVDRTTDGTGNVTQMAMADVRKLDAGRWFHPIFAGVKVPTLEEVFQLILQRQPAPVTVALNMKIMSPGIEKNIVALVERYNLFGQLFAFGQPADSSRRLKEANPRMLATLVPDGARRYAPVRHGRIGTPPEAQPSLPAETPSGGHGLNF